MSSLGSLGSCWSAACLLLLSQLLLPVPLPPLLLPGPQSPIFIFIMQDQLAESYMQLKSPELASHKYRIPGRLPPETSTSTITAHKQLRTVRLCMSTDVASLPSEAPGKPADVLARFYFQAGQHQNVPIPGSFKFHLSVTSDP